VGTSLVNGTCVAPSACPTGTVVRDGICVVQLIVSPPQVIAPVVIPQIAPIQQIAVQPAIIPQAVQAVAAPQVAPPAVQPQAPAPTQQVLAATSSRPQQQVLAAERISAPSAGDGGLLARRHGTQGLQGQLVGFALMLVLLAVTGMFVKRSGNRPLLTTAPDAIQPKVYSMESRSSAERQLAGFAMLFTILGLFGVSLRSRK